MQGSAFGACCKVPLWFSVLSITPVPIKWKLLNRILKWNGGNGGGELFTHIPSK